MLRLRVSYIFLSGTSCIGITRGYIQCGRWTNCSEEGEEGSEGWCACRCVRVCQQRKADSGGTVAVRGEDRKTKGMGES